jgi:hypothetical protein
VHAVQPLVQLGGAGGDLCCCLLALLQRFHLFCRQLIDNAVSSVKRSRKRMPP